MQSQGQCFSAVALRISGLTDTIEGICQVRGDLPGDPSRYGGPVDLVSTAKARRFLLGIAPVPGCGPEPGMGTGARPATAVRRDAVNQATFKHTEGLSTLVEYRELLQKATHALSPEQVRTANDRGAAMTPAAAADYALLLLTEGAGQPATGPGLAQLSAALGRRLLALDPAQPVPGGPPLNDEHRGLLVEVRVYDLGDVGVEAVAVGSLGE